MPIAPFEGRQQLNERHRRAPTHIRRIRQHHPRVVASKMSARDQAADISHDSADAGNAANNPAGCMPDPPTNNIGCRAVCLSYRGARGRGGLELYLDGYLRCSNCDKLIPPDHHILHTTQTGRLQRRCPCCSRHLAGPRAAPTRRKLAVIKQEITNRYM